MTRNSFCATFLLLGVYVGFGNGFPGSMDNSPYCAELARITDLCNELFIQMVCPMTCGSGSKVNRQCGIRKFGPNIKEWEGERPEGEIEEHLRKREGGELLRKRIRRIVGGTESVHGAWPWHVALYFKGKMKCAGAVISENWILSAANCFDQDTSSYNPSDWLVSAGEYRMRTPEQTEQLRNVKNIIIHPRNFKFWQIGYKNVPDDYDIALLKLSTPLVLNDYVSPLCLPNNDDFFTSSNQCRIVGWGKGTSKASSGSHNKLREAPVKLVPRDICNLPISYNGSIHHRAICAGYDSVNGDACDYDSGGALSCKKNGVWTAVGLVSWGYQCGKPNYYGVYTNVPLLKSWIIETLLGYNDVMNRASSLQEKLKNSTQSHTRVPAKDYKTYLERNRE